MPTIPNTRTRLTGVIVTVAQEIVGFICRVLLRIWGGYSLTNRLSKLGHAQRYIIASNHQSRLDPFVVFSLLPTKYRRVLLPVKSMTWAIIYYAPFVRPFAWLLGCFPSHSHGHPNKLFGLEASLTLLNQGFNIYIAPEGSRTLRKDSDPKQGISRMLAASPDTKLLLVHLEWRVYSKWRRHLTMTIAEAPKDLDVSNPKTIMDAIYAL